MTSRRPDGWTLAAFAVVATVGGTNFVAVRLSNRELPPFFGAGIRFVAASLIVSVAMTVVGVRFPTRREMPGPVLFGVLGFFLAYAFVYWGLQKVPAALGGVVFGTVPLITFVLAVLHGLERFRWRALVGAAIAIGGVAIMVGAPSGTAISVLPFLAVVTSAIGAAESAVLVKRSPPVHPLALNAVAMGIGGVLLLAFSAASREPWAVPRDPTTWWTLAFLVPVGSAGMFFLVVFVLQRWTASAASYQFVFFPVVAALAAAVILDEPLSWSVAAGAALVIAGTYVGALAAPAHPTEAPERQGPMRPTIVD